MSDELRIEIEHPERAREPGEVVEGRVRVRTDRGEKCEGVVLKQYWQTHGRGNTDREIVTERTLHGGALAPGEEHVFPFQVEVPPGPFTYHGKILNVDHYVEASMEVPWAFDPKAEVEIGVVPGSGAPPPPESFYGEASQMVRGGQTGCGALFGIIFIVVGFTILPFGLLFVAVGVAILIPPIRKAIAARKLGGIEASVHPQVVTPGGETVVRVAVRPDKDVELNRVSATVLCREICVSGSGTDKTTHREEIHSEEIVIEGPSSVPGGEVTLLEGTVRLPDLHAYTFTGSSNKVVWQADVHVDIPSWPDWTGSVFFVVWPEPGAGVRTAPEEGRGSGDAVTGGAEQEEPGVAAGTAAALGPAAGGAMGGGDPDAERSEAEAGKVEGVESAARIEAEEAAEAEGDVAFSWSGPGGEPVETGQASRPADADVEAGEPAPPTPPPPSAAPEVEEHRDAPEPPAPEAPEIARRIHAILAEPRFGGARPDRIRELVGREYDFTLVVEENERSFGVPAEYRNGRTIVGTVEGTDLSVEVRFPSDRNPELTELDSGDRVEVRGTAIEWGTLDGRPLLEA